MTPNAFIGWMHAPTESDLETALGAAKPVWDRVIVDMAQRASAYYGPSAAAADLAEAIYRNTRRVLSVSTLLDGEFAYAEPLRLALQNLALGRPTQLEAAPESALRVEVRDPDYSDEMSGRLTKLEGAISKQRTVRFGYWSPRRTRPGERSVNPYALRLADGNWYVIGQDLERDTVRT